MSSVSNSKSDIIPKKISRKQRNKNKRKELTGKFNLILKEYKVDVKLKIKNEDEYGIVLFNILKNEEIRRLRRLDDLTNQLVDVERRAQIALGYVPRYPFLLSNPINPPEPDHRNLNGSQYLFELI